MIDIRDREEFEEWAEKNGLDTSMWDSKAYYSSPTTLAWKLWEDLHTIKIDVLKAEVESLRQQLSLSDIAQECLDADMEEEKK